MDDSDLKAKLAVLDERSQVTLAELRSIRETMVTRVEFGVVQKIVFGLVGLVMSSAIGFTLFQAFNTR